MPKFLFIFVAFFAVTLLASLSLFFPPETPARPSGEDLPKEEKIKIANEKIKIEVSPKITPPPPIQVAEIPLATVEADPVVISEQEKKPVLPPLDESAILNAIVKIECPTEDGLGKYIGSGFLLKENTVVTAAHVIKDSASRECAIIFPKDRRPVHYLKGTSEDLNIVRQRHDEEGIDVALLFLPPLENYPEAKAIFSAYPAIPYPVCSEPRMLGDKLLHFGYPSNYLDQNYLSRLEGEAVISADIQGIKEELSQDQTYTYKSPVFVYTYDESNMHPYMVSRVASFYGDSGGLAFNAEKQCVIGPHRGGTIGRAAGENYSVFINLEWKGACQAGLCLVL